jgi:nitrate reductase beta subunit
MSKVHNWQIGREMNYPYTQAFPRRQFAFVFNINRCIACQSCTMACKSTWTFSKGQEHMWWANVETKPYGGYPQFWDAKILELLEKANPDNQNWTGKPSNDRRSLTANSMARPFEAQNTLTPDSARVLGGYLPTDEEWNSPTFTKTSGWQKGVRNELDKEELRYRNIKPGFLSRAHLQSLQLSGLPACRASVYNGLKMASF